MRKLGFFDKVIFFFNSVFATVLLLAYGLPYIPPKTFPFLSILSLGIPLLLIGNFIFLLYWVIRLKRQFLLSFLVLLIGLSHIAALYKFSGTTRKNVKESIKLMSYNVRQFNQYNWIKSDTVTEQIIHFIEKESPDILCLQDYYQRDNVRFSNFEHHYIKLKNNNSKFGQAIFSNYPIVATGSLDFPDTYNNAIYADLLIKNDTVRVFNVHLESLKLNPNVKDLQEEDRKKLIGRVGKSFRMQQEQQELLQKKIEETSYKSIVCGDFNNSPFSYVYRKLSEGYQDAFKEAGKGFGETFVFDFIPLRIDMVLADKNFEIAHFQNYTIELSDHYPITAYLRFAEE